jgi:hypothetical protein
MSRSRKAAPIRVFLSYSNKDRKFAGSIREQLQPLRFSVFVAHDDMVPSGDFVTTILAMLRKCEILICLLTPNFETSDWTDQECGFALANDKIILPISKGPNPHGFIRDKQAYKIKKGEPISLVVKRALAGLATHKSVRSRFRNVLISSIRSSRSFEDSILRIGLLKSFAPLTRKQLALILKYADANDQVYRSVGAMKEFRQLMKGNLSKIDKKLRIHYGELLNS